MSEPTLESKPNRDASHPTSRFRFRTLHLLYATAIIGAYLATFGEDGLVLAVFCLLGWCGVFSERTRAGQLSTLTLFLLLMMLLVILLFPQTTFPSRSSHQRDACLSRLSELGDNLTSYHAIHGSFPPAYTVDPHGNRLHSWRTLIYPALTSHPSFRIDEPWNNPSNQAAARAVPSPYRCSEEPSPSDADETSYVAVIGPNTMWRGAESTSLSNFTASSDLVIGVIEFHHSGIHWMEPRDISLDVALDYLASSEKKSGHPDVHFFQSAVGIHVVRANGAVRYFHFGHDRNWLASQFSILESETPDDSTNTWKPRYDNWLRLTIVLLLSLWPLPWIANQRDDNKRKTHLEVG